MFAKACSRSASVTSSTWSKRAIALRTCAASVSGSFRLSGNANTLSGRRILSWVSSSPCCSCGFQVVVAIRHSYPGPMALHSQTGLDLGYRLLVVLEQDRVHAVRRSRVHAHRYVIEENGLLRPQPEPGTGQLVDPRIALAQAHLVRVHGIVDKIGHPVRQLLPLAGADETVGQDAGAVARAQATRVLDQFDVERAEIARPHLLHHCVHCG